MKLKIVRVRNYVYPLDDPNELYMCCCTRKGTHYIFKCGAVVKELKRREVDLVGKHILVDLEADEHFICTLNTLKDEYLVSDGVCWVE